MIDEHGGVNVAERSDEHILTAKGNQPAASGRTENAAPIDVQRLADKVYRLMLAEARLARARDGR
jgi:hypothetical protein